MKKRYETPRLVEYGRIDQVTFGANGENPDAVIVGGVPRISAHGPACTGNVASGHCHRF